MNQPFVTFYTPTFRRPRQLAACLASVAVQTVATRIEQIVIPDHVGLGVGGMFERVPLYKDAVHGEYVHFLADDDELAQPDVVERLAEFAFIEGYPAVIIVRVQKGATQLPKGQGWNPPVCGEIDLGCMVVRADVWKAHAQDYGARYEGDFDMAKALHDAGHRFVFCDLFFLVGAVSRGTPEAVAV